MLPIEPRRLDGGDEELGPICILPSIGHTQPAWVHIQIDSIPTSSPISSTEIPTLNHEVLYYTMELAAFVTKSFLLEKLIVWWTGFIFPISLF
uniref:Uncharacterized protein n=1 Tax=Paramormyrops kingsleyae TaxID=1676925 RepID=A0A3B3SMF7_9TELE